MERIILMIAMTVMPRCLSVFGNIEVDFPGILEEHQESDRAKPCRDDLNVATISEHDGVLSRRKVVLVVSAIALTEAIHQDVRLTTVEEVIIDGYIDDGTKGMSLDLCHIVTEQISTCNHHEIMVSEGIARKLDVPGTVRLLVELEMKDFLHCLWFYLEFVENKPIGSTAERSRVDISRITSGILPVPGIVPAWSHVQIESIIHPGIQQHLDKGPEWYGPG